MRSESDWEKNLSEQLGVPAQVTFGRSRSTPVQVRWNGKRPQVRFHNMFGEAPEEIVTAVVAWLQHGRRARKACRELDAWIHAQLELLPAPTRRVTKAVGLGTTHDLGQLVAELREETLAGQFEVESDKPTLPALTWGRRAKSRSRHTLQLGSYSPESHLIRIHPVLDQEAVPAWFVRYVLFHELLHALIPAQQVGSRRWRHHCPDFRKRESEYEDYARALVWEKANLPALIRSARTGKPMKGRSRTKANPERRENSVLEKLQGLLFPT